MNPLPPLGPAAPDEVIFPGLCRPYIRTSKCHRYRYPEEIKVQNHRVPTLDICKIDVNFLKH